MKKIEINKRARALCSSTNIAVFSGVGIAVCLLSMCSPARAQDRDVAIIPSVPESVIMDTLTESCEMMGRVHEREEKAIVCNTTRIGSRHQTIIRMTYEPKGEGYSIKTMTQINFGGILTWARGHSNYPMDLVLARHIIEKQAQQS